MPKSSCAARCTVSVAAWFATSVPAMIPTPSATPRIVRALRRGRASSPRQARALRRIGSGASALNHPHLEAELRESPDQVAGLVVRSPAEAHFVQQRSVAHHEYAVRVRGRARVVGHQHDGLAESVARVPQQVQDLGASRVVEVAGRLVGKDDRRLRGQGPGQATRCCSPAESWSGL